MRQRTLLGRSGLIAAAALLVVAMSGCSDGDDQGGGAVTGAAPSRSSATPAGTSSPGTEPSTDTSAPTEGATSPSGADMPEETQALLRAGSLGLEEVANSTVYSIESENGGDVWEVEVVTPDGAKHEMYIAADGQSVAQPPRADGQKTKYRERIEGATIDFQQAVEVVLGQVPSARIKELNLDHDRGVIVWEADVADDSGTARSLKIDAASGEVLKNEVDN